MTSNAVSNLRQSAADVTKVLRHSKHGAQSTSPPRLRQHLRVVVAEGGDDGGGGGVGGRGDLWGVARPRVMHTATS